MSDLVQTLFGALGGGILTLFGAVLMLPKIKAEARKLNVDADDKIVARLYREIDRLDKAQDELAADFQKFKETAADRESELERENRSLRTEVTRLKLRVQGLEDILRVKPLTAEDKALLDELDRKTRKS